MIMFPKTEMEVETLSASYHRSAPDMIRGFRQVKARYLITFFLFFHFVDLEQGKIMVRKKCHQVNIFNFIILISFSQAI